MSCQIASNHDPFSDPIPDLTQCRCNLWRAWQFSTQELPDVPKKFASESDLAGPRGRSGGGENGKIIVVTRAASEGSQCPACGSLSRRIHSRYHRTISDLLAHGHAVEIEVTVRRFQCAAIACQRQIFAERLAGEMASPFARRTVRLDRIVHCCGVALGGRPAARLARRLMLPVSRDTLLRTVRRQARRYDAPLHVVGIDDWAWKRGRRYGTLICDLERRRIVDLLPDRNTGTVAAWLTARRIIVGRKIWLIPQSPRRPTSGIELNERASPQAPLFCVVTST